MRIKRRIGSNKNSGFAFIQFASKTAARRMYKVFKKNSYLIVPKNLAGLIENIKKIIKFEFFSKI